MTSMGEGELASSRLPEEKLVKSLQTLDQTLHLVNTLRAGVRRIFRDLTQTSGPARLKAALEENTTAVKGDLNALSGLVSDLHQIVQDAEATRQGLLNTNGFPLPEGMFINDINEPVSASQLHMAYTWEKKAACHGLLASKRAREELSNFPSVCQKIFHNYPSFELGRVPVVSRWTGGEGEKARNLHETLTWVATYEPRMDIGKEMQGDRLVGLKVKIECVFQAHITLRTIGYDDGDQIVLADSAVVFGLDEETGACGMSDHLVFQKLTQRANAGLLHYRLHNPQHMLPAFLSWVHSHHDVFTAKCVTCGKQLALHSETFKFLPPTWRSFNQVDGEATAYHEQCVPKAQQAF